MAVKRGHIPLTTAEKHTLVRALYDAIQFQSDLLDCYHEDAKAERRPIKTTLRKYRALREKYFAGPVTRSPLALLLEQATPMSITEIARRISKGE